MLAKRIAGVVLGSFLLLASSGTAEHGLRAESPERVYVTNFDENFVSVLDAGGYRKIADISTGRKPHGVTVTPDGRKVYLTHEDDGTVAVIDAVANRVKATFLVGGRPNQACTAADGSTVYVTDNAGHQLLRIDTVTDQVDLTGSFCTT